MSGAGEPRSLSLQLASQPGGSMFVLAHGAGGNMDDPLLLSVTDELLRRGHGVARFNFAYREAGKKLPDRQPALLASYRQALARVREQSAARLFIGGKSMGGRMASILAAEGEAIAGLVCLGYPLHPAKQPHKLRDAHLPNIAQPSLFLQGTRDALCDLDLMRPRVAAMQNATLFVLEGGDHSLGVPKRAGLSRAEVASLLVDQMASAFGL